MLHEILLSLSGIPSSIWKDLTEENDVHDGQDDSSRIPISAPEREMVGQLAELADLHLKVIQATTNISKSHPSRIWRAVCNRIKTVHLRDFTRAIIDIEASILKEDTKYVGAYNIVPLSTIVTEFQPWVRPLRWLWKTLQRMSSKNATKFCTGAELLEYLQREGQTGYTDLRDLSVDLLVAAQQSWMQGLTPWILYGELLRFGSDDFMVKELSVSGNPDFSIRTNCVPYFISPESSEIVLGIGKALNQIRSRAWLDQKQVFSGDVCTDLLSKSLEQIRSLSYPIQSKSFDNAMNSINESISQAALSRLLPLNLILELLLILQDYVLFRNGEFSTCLIRQAESFLRTDQNAPSTSNFVRKLGRLDGLTASEADLTSILSKTWSEFSALVPDHEFDNPLHEKARTWLVFKHTTSSVPVSTLLPTSSSLFINLPPESPLLLFITTSDIDYYSRLSAYLISVHRAQAQLGKLWKIPAHRRCYPAPAGPPLSATRQGRQSLEKRRQRELHRSGNMRTHWACAHQVHFLLSEITNYFHGEVMLNSWTQLRTWLNFDNSSDRPASSRFSSRPATASSKPAASLNSSTASNPPKLSDFKSRRDDPRTAARAHRKYLEALQHSLLLDNTEYIAILRELLITVDHFVALFQRLQTVWQGLDLQQDEGMVDAFSDYTREEQDLMAEMARTNNSLMDQLHELVASMRETEKERDLNDTTTGIGRIGLSGNNNGDDFEPWKARTLDRLLMKLDFLSGEREEKFENALVGIDDDDNDDV